MKEQILQFVEILRGSGVRIAPEETLDCLTGMEHVDLRDRNLFRALLRTTLVKRARDIPAFEHLFDLFFGFLAIPDEDLAPPAEASGPEASLREILEQADGALPSWLRKLAVEGLAALYADLMEAGNRAGIREIRYPMQAPHYVQKIRKALGMAPGDGDLAALEAALARQGIPADTLAVLEGRLASRVRRFEEMIRRYVDRQAQARLPKLEREAPDTSLMEKPFGALNSLEIRSMDQAVRELARKIRDEVSLRQRRSRKGRLSLKHTLRRSVRYGGVPMELKFRKRRKTRPRIVALCDVSSSVWNASRFMLHLLYSLQDCFDHVRSFVFVDRLGEVTECFERRPVNEAVQAALHDAGIPYHRYTDYGSVFEAFCRDWMDTVNRRTTVIVIGDGRNNFFSPGEDSLARIRLRARRVIWLNPESRAFWRFGDSMMHRYERNCDQARECRNLKQLTDFVNELSL